MSGHSFSRVPTINTNRSTFRRDFNRKMTFDAGYLVPIMIDEALPGDTLNLNLTAFGRLANPVYPIMDNLYLDTFYFAVPYRLVWENWERFNGAQSNIGDSTDFLIPQLTSPTGGHLNGSIHDYFGIPTGIENLAHSSLWHRAYNLIWNEWFRDQNLQDSVNVEMGDGPDNLSDYQLLKRGKRHDYFTSCLVSPQKGPAVQLPLSGNADFSIDADSGNTTVGIKSNPSGDLKRQFVSGTDSGFALSTADGRGGEIQAYADLSSVTSATVNQLRQAFQIQRLLEKDARGGTRYTELIQNHFNVTSPDARLQRPEYLGGGSNPLNVNPVPQTSSSDSTSPQGNVSAYGTIKHRDRGFTKSFTEHSLIIGLACVRADLTYQQGLPRMFSRRVREDFYWPVFQSLGEQAVLNKEIFAQGNSTDDDVFGYQERYAEYRYKNNEICGQFRSNYAQSLDAWHLAQNFLNLPTLSPDFIEENPPVDRVKAVADSYPDIIMDMFYKYKCHRPMPMYSVPGFIDHF
ncbi:major capsid protein [Microviridae sp.]|nr:major capsid protein [Microviridae sp.]